MAFLPTDGPNGVDLSQLQQDPNATPNPQQGGSALAQGAATVTPEQVKSYYEKYLGRDPGAFANGQADPGETGSAVWDAWKTMDPTAAENAIKGSAEAQLYSKNGSGLNYQLPGTGGATNPLNTPNYSGGPAPLAASQGVNPQLTNLRNMLYARATQSLVPDANDPVIKAQTDAYAADVTRGGRDFLSQQAESAGPVNNMDAAYRSVGEKAGQAVADRRGQLMQGVVDARRKEISDALSGLGGTLSLEEQTRLRQEDQDLARQRFGADTAQQTFENNYKTIFG